MYKTAFFFAAFLAALGFFSITPLWATVPEFPAPEWFRVSAELRKPAKPGEKGTIRFFFQPLVRKAFEVEVRFFPPEGFGVSGPAKASIKAADMKNSFCDFEFIAPAEERTSGARAERAFTGYFEFSTGYPAAELSAVAKEKYGVSLPEAKKLLESIGKAPAKYLSSLAFGLFSTASECALDPDAYFPYADASGFLQMVSTLPLGECPGVVEDFKKRYGEALALGTDEFKAFVSATGCDFASDLAEFMDASLFEFLPAGKIKAPAVAEISVFLEKLKAFREAGKKPPAVPAAASGSLARAYITLFAFYNSAAVFDFKHVDRKKGIGEMNNLIALAASVRKGEQAPAMKRVAAYLEYNAGLMAKISGDKSSASHFERAAALNPALFIPGR